MEKSIIIKKQVREIMGGLRTSSKYYPALENKIKEMIENSKKRAIANGRRTVLARDL